MGRREAELRENTGKARTVKFRAVGKEDRATGEEGSCTKVIL